MLQKSRWIIQWPTSAVLFPGVLIVVKINKATTFKAHESIDGMASGSKTTQQFGRPIHPCIHGYDKWKKPCLRRTRVQQALWKHLISPHPTIMWMNAIYWRWVSLNPAYEIADGGFKIRCRNRARCVYFFPCLFVKF